MNMDLGKALQIAVEAAHSSETPPSRESAAVHMSVKDLSGHVRSALREVGFNKASIGVKSATTYRFKTPYGEGYQSFAILINLETGQTKSFESSWGGRNPYETKQIDVDERNHPIPSNAAVISGQRGGGHPTSATLYIHPDKMPKELPAMDELTDAEKRILVMFRSYTSAYRKEILRASDESTIDKLVAKGLLKRNKAGATGITNEGKNAISNVRMNL
jgi:hypothetical protein